MKKLPAGTPPELQEILKGDLPDDMQPSLERRIIAWNRDRNGLKFDMDLELKMLKEEAQEFFESTTFYNMLREYSDFRFVWTGSQAKHLAASAPNNVTAFTMQREQWAEVQAYARDVLSQMFNILLEQFFVFGVDHTELIHKLLEDCLEAVVSANENKGTERDENGKVKKGPNYVAPDKRIQDILRETIGRVE